MTTNGIWYHTGHGLGGYHGTGATNQALHNSASHGAGAANQASAFNHSVANILATAAAYHGASRKPLEREGIKVGEIIGYRMWRVKDGYLVAFSADHAWPPNEVMKGDPKENNNEGIWSFKEKSRALNKMLDCGNAVMGSIKMWGNIIEYTCGYRAEFAKIVTLDAIRPMNKKLLQQLKEEYGV